MILRRFQNAAGKEGKIISYIINFAKKNKLKYKKDKVGNVLIKKDAYKGKENSKTIILQAHVDMVCEKNPDVKFNFDKDAIQLKRNNDWLSANKTTLGADDGIGVAMILAILSDKTLVHGPLECLFTVSEETGLVGAKALKKGFLSGKYLINLDFGDDKEFCIGSAGGEGFFIEKKLTRVESNKELFLEISISGLLGGHSGVDINKNRGNSIKIITTLLNEFNFNFEIGSFDAGNKLNAIPRDAKVVIGVDKKDYDILTGAAKKIEIKSTKRVVFDKKISFLINRIARQKNVLSESSKKEVLSLLQLLPNGIVSMEKKMKNCVETSINLAKVSLTEKYVEIGMFARSSNDKKLKKLVSDVKLAAKKNKSTFIKESSTPSWQPNVNSVLCKTIAYVYEDLYHSKPKIVSVHAGLEPGDILKKYPSLDCISIGPLMENLHSPTERLSVSSTRWVYGLLVKTLEKL